MTEDSIHATRIEGLNKISTGKVRDIYQLDERHLLMVTSDRLSAFDVVLPQPIPGKGEVLTRVSAFWFARTAGIVPNHLSGPEQTAAVVARYGLQHLGDRVQLVKRLRPLPVEAIVRGYLIGSGWKDYQRSGGVCGIPLPAGLRLAERLPEPIFTPSTKAAVGDHDENIDFDATVRLMGEDIAGQVRDLSLRIYREAADYAAGRGIIIADTKFEFGQDEQGRVHLIDEVLTPDSSRFWPVDSYRVGISPPSFDKQFVRDYLEGLDWDKKPPGPDLPAQVIARTAAKYREAEQRLTGN
jgi:phosphoribosylaminoimidazole-succinocarboxamide synthase